MSSAVTRGKRVAIAGVLAVGVALLIYYTYRLKAEDWRGWRRLEVVFEDVGGLRKKDPVVLAGARVGRVAEVVLFEDRQMAILEVEPDAELFADARVKIVSANALGFVQVELHPGTRGGPPLPTDRKLEGELFVGVGQGPPGPGRTKELSRGIHETALATKLIQDPGGSAWGAALFDRDRAERLAHGLRDAHASWEATDEALAAIEHGEGLGRALDPASASRLLTTIAGARNTLARVGDGLTRAAAGDGTAGRILGDPVEALAWRESTHRVARGLAAGRRGEGTLGLWSAPGTGHSELLRGTIDGIAATTSAARHEGRGLLGMLSSEGAGDGLRSTLRSLPHALERFDRSSAVRDPEAKHALWDGAARLDDVAKSLERFVKSIRHDLPVRQNFTGAVFAIF